MNWVRERESDAKSSPPTIETRNNKVSTEKKEMSHSSFQFCNHHHHHGWNRWLCVALQKMCAENGNKPRKYIYRRTKTSNQQRNETKKKKLWKLDKIRWLRQRGREQMRAHTFVNISTMIFIQFEMHSHGVCFSLSLSCCGTAIDTAQHHECRSPQQIGNSQRQMIAVNLVMSKCFLIISLFLLVSKSFVVLALYRRRRNVSWFLLEKAEWHGRME